MSTTATQIINTAYADLGVKAIGETLSTELLADGLTRLNDLVGDWFTQGLTMLTVDKHVFGLTANVGTYLIGPAGTGDFATARPPSISNTAILLNSASNPVENLLGPPITDDQYAAIAIKTLTNLQFTQVYYNQTYPNGTIILWPIPTVDTNDLVLYYPTALTEFADLTTQYNLAPAYPRALAKNLAVELSTPNGREVPAMILRLAETTLSNLKRQNVKPTDLSFDPALIGYQNRGSYNINSDQGG